MSLNKPTCILNCPLVEKFFENDCSTFVATSNMSFTTKFDGHNVDHNIEIADETVNGVFKYCMFVTFNLTPAFYWRFLNTNDQKKSFLKMAEQLENNKGVTESVSGGGNSYWYFRSKGNGYELFFDISGCGDATVGFDIPKEQGDECIRIMEKVYQAVESQ